MSRAVHAAGLILLTTLTPTRGVGQQAPPPLDQAAIREVVAGVSEALRANYVFPDVGERYATGLTQMAENYPAGMSYAELAARVTADLQSIQQDLHLRLSPLQGAQPGRGVQRVVVPGGSPAPAGRRVQTAAPPGQGQPQAGGERVVVRGGGGAVPAASPGAPDPDQLFAPLEMADLPEAARGMFAAQAQSNHFFRAVEILPGNVGYVDYDQFGVPNFSVETADAAFAFLKDASAIILDLRGNRGGIEGMNQYLASHFFGEEPVHLYSRYYGSSSSTVEYPTYPDRVKHRFPDVPVFVLIDGGTGSAAENLSFSLQGLDRATLVGEATAGAAHSSRGFPIGQDFTLQIPIARAFNPRTNEDWEGEGVLPDLPVSSADALETAHSAAIAQMMETADGDERLALEDAALLMAARSSDASGTADPDEYAGEYGNRAVFAEDGGLRMRRTDVQGGAALHLVQLGPDYFTLAQSSVARIRFERDASGRVSLMHVRLPNGVWETGERR